MSLILASASPRRRQLLKRLVGAFTVFPSGVAERPPAPGECAESYALQLARAKAQEIKERFPDDVVLGADTVVVIDGIILGKPAHASDAERMLRLLRGRRHTVTTAVVVLGASVAEGVESALVAMRAYSDEEIWSYVAGREPMDKAGAYAVQGAGGRLVEGVEGCYETVVGLPLCLTGALLSRQGIESGGAAGACTHLPPGTESASRAPRY